MQKNSTELYQPMWVDLSHLKKLLIYPLEIRDWLLEDIVNNFQNAPREAKLELTDLRQSL